MRGLDLETSAALLEMLTAVFRRLGHDLAAIQRLADESGRHSLSDELHRLACDVYSASAIPEALAARDEFRTNPTEK